MKFFKIFRIPVIINYSMNIHEKSIFDISQQECNIILKTDMNCIVL